MHACMQVSVFAYINVRAHTFMSATAEHRKREASLIVM